MARLGGLAGRRGKASRGGGVRALRRCSGRGTSKLAARARVANDVWAAEAWKSRRPPRHRRDACSMADAVPHRSTGQDSRDIAEKCLVKNCLLRRGPAALITASHEESSPVSAAITGKSHPRSGARLLPVRPRPESCFLASSRDQNAAQRQSAERPRNRARLSIIRRRSAYLGVGEAG